MIISLGGVFDRPFTVDFLPLCGHHPQLASQVFLANSTDRARALVKLQHGVKEVLDPEHFRHECNKYNLESCMQVEIRGARYLKTKDLAASLQVRQGSPPS